FLSHSCLSGSSACPLAHVLDPCRLPVCEFHEGTGCTRVHCPYLHTSYPPNTPLCPAFLRGRCPLGRSCKLRHAWNSLSCAKRKINRTSSTAPASSMFISTPHLPVNVAESERNSIADYSQSDQPPPAPLPEGSLRHTYPAPIFIPLFTGFRSDYFRTSNIEKAAF
ncbi:Zinc finger CCCH domain-containing protein 3, partial [Paragonimus westermani]